MCLSYKPFLIKEYSIGGHLWIGPGRELSWDNHKPRPADNLKKYKIKHIPKNVILKIQDMS